MTFLWVIVGYRYFEGYDIILDCTYFTKSIETPGGGCLKKTHSPIQFSAQSEAINHPIESQVKPPCIRKSTHNFIFYVVLIVITYYYYCQH